MNKSLKRLRYRNLRNQSAQHVQEQNLAESHTRVFIYKELDQRGNHIRLLRILPKDGKSRERQVIDSSEIRCELFHANLDNHPSYKALSYTWGSETDPKHAICLDGCHFEVRENLWSALNRFQAGNVAPVIWIDAICINQLSDTERNHQVAKMKMIYEQATEVVVWLGESYDNSDLAFQLVEELYDHRESTIWITERFSKADIGGILLSLGMLLDRDYWWRIWVVQELTVAKKIIFYCGDNLIEAKCLHAVQQLFVRMLNLDGFPRDLMLDFLGEKSSETRTRLHFQGILSIYSWKQTLVSTNPNFYTSLLHHHYRRSSDPRDMIYGLTALANQTSKYQVEVDYNLSTEATYTNFAKLEIETSKKLDIITRVVPGRRTAQLPSWAPDWSSNANPGHIFLQRLSNSKPTVYFVTQSEAVVAFNKDGMKFKGVVIGSVDLLSPRTGMEGSFDKRNGSLALRRWWEIVAEMDGTSMAEHKAFVQTLTFDQILESRRSTKAELLLGTLGYFIFVFSDLDPTQAGSSILYKYWQSFLISKRKAYLPLVDDVGVEEVNKTHMKTWIDLIFAHIWDRRFFISSTGAMGLASQEVTKGDLICIPLGCCHPVILRKVEDHYINLGEAYVDGYMYGEAMDMLERGELKLEEFELR
jgi:hypothetical protein